MKYCEVCRGDGHIRLPLWPRLDIAWICCEDIKTTASHRDFPCPQCAETVPYTRLEVCKVGRGPLKAYDEAQQLDFIRRDACNALAEGLIRRDLVKFEKSPLDPVTGTFSYVGTIGIVSQKHVATLEERVAERQFEVAEEAIDITIEEIANWSSYYSGRMGGRVEASQAVGWLRDALKRLREKYNAARRK